MKCIVRMRKTEIGTPEVFVPKKMKAEELLKEMFEKEKIILTADDELDEYNTHYGERGAVIQTINDNYTEFFVVNMVEVER